ncbi:HIT family protein [Nanchangia anserum]|uniref:HIT family protein n=1 Tax=Nanchangia anserum TaxID=2692125 RepID=A0A8I0GAA8_9ACTO|nr:HIT family protein [Nanchangia anserum]MBD3689113.1 HIT family protein [Nanchangia anserum]QOX81348.1 HIT family protein [Nanchangia anserum]
METVFTQIINGSIPGTFVWADETCVAFATIEPVQPGHLLLVPREPVESYWQAPPETVAHMARVAQIISRAQLEACGGARVGQIVAGFDVPHLHIHLIPLRDQSQLRLDGATPGDPEDIAEACERIRAALRAAGETDHVCEAAPGA